LTASAKALALWVWKLPSGHTVDKSQFAVAATARVEKYPAAIVVVAPAVKVRRVIIRPLHFNEIEAHRLRARQPAKP
jgi:hypothetical protein